MGLLSKVLIKGLAKRAAKRGGVSKSMTFAQKRALRRAQKESARLRSMRTKSPSDYYKGTDVRKLRVTKFKPVKGGVKLAKPQVAKLSEARKMHQQLGKITGRNTSAMTDKQVGRALNKAYRRQAWRSASTGAKVHVAARSAVAGGAVGYAGYSTTKTLMANRKKRRRVKKR